VDSFYGACYDVILANRTTALCVIGYWLDTVCLSVNTPCHLSKSIDIIDMFQGYMNLF